MFYNKIYTAMFAQHIQLYRYKQKYLHFRRQWVLLDKKIVGVSDV